MRSKQANYFDQAISQLSMTAQESEGLEDITPAHLLFRDCLSGIVLILGTTLESGIFRVYLSARRNSRPTASSSRPVSIHYDYVSIGEG